MQFSPFPLRARGSLEIFDAAIKLYKQYFWVLLGWSAIVSGVTLCSALLPLGGFAGMFIAPLSIGSVVCCIAAAVRGQRVEFGQCWRFTQPRYWMMLGMHLLGSLIGGLILCVVIAILIAVGVAGVYAFRQSSGAVQITMGILAFLVFGLIGTIAMTICFSWVSLVPVVICMEEDKRGTTALGRAYEILRGHWLRITTLMAIVGLAVITLFAILSGLAALVIGIGRIGELMQGRGVSDGLLWLVVGTTALSYVVFLIIWSPLYYLILSVFYLDVRVRQEGLDLEWTAHATAPTAPAPQTDSAFIQTPGAPMIPMTPAAPDAPPIEYSPLQAQPSAPVQSALDSHATQRLTDEADDAAWSTPDIISPESSTPEASTPESSTPESSTPEASTPEASTPEASTPEAHIPSANISDAPLPREAALADMAEPSSPNEPPAPQ